MALRPSVRLAIEKNIDRIVHDPEYWRNLTLKCVKFLDIDVPPEHDVDSALVFTVGYLMGEILYRTALEGIILSDEENSEVLSLIKRRVREVRDAMLT